MTIKIENMVPNPGDGVAKFDAVFPGGWIIRRCVVIRRPDGNLAAVTPLVGPGIRSVTIPDRYWFEFINAAIDAYAELTGDDPQAGLRRVIGEDVEDALQLAGLGE